MGQTTSHVCYGVLQRVKQHQRFVTECCIGSNKTTGFLRNGTKGETASEDCRSGTKGQTTSRCWLRSGTKGQTTSDICYGVLQRVKEHHRFVTEWYKWSNKIRGVLPSISKGQTTSEVYFGVVQSFKQH